MIARHLTAALVATFVLALSPDANADAKGFGDKGELIISGDRLMPLFAYERVGFDENVQNGVREVSVSNTSSSLLYGATHARLTPHTVPRAGIDYTVIPHLTIGGFFAFGLGLGGSRNTETITQNVRTETSLDTGTGLTVGVGPRVGYILPMGDVLAFWLRGGVSFYSLNAKNDDNNNNVNVTVSTTNTTFSIDLDPQLTIVPLEHFFFTVGPLVNIPFAGSTTVSVERPGRTDSVTNDLSSFHLGVTAGLGGWFNL